MVDATLLNYCAVTDIVRPNYVGQHLSGLAASDCSPPLMAGQLWLATHSERA
jgi:hypothetical protein